MSEDNVIPVIDEDGDQIGFAIAKGNTADVTISDPKTVKNLSQLTNEELLFKGLEIIYNTINQAESQGRVNLRDAAIYSKSVASEIITEYKSRKLNVK